MKLAPWKNKRQELAPTGADAQPLMRLRDEMDHLFDRFMRQPLAGFFGTDEWPGDSLGWDPKLDLTENPKQITLRIELPGVKPDQVEIEASGRLLTIRGEKHEEKEEKTGAIQHRECSYGSFFRSIELPANVNSDKINARFKDGVLTVTADKIADEKSHKIAVRNG